MSTGRDSKAAKTDPRDRRERIHFEGCLDIVDPAGQRTLIDTLGRDLAVCFTCNPLLTTLPHKVTCKRCLNLMKKASETEANRATLRAKRETQS